MIGGNRIIFFFMRESIGSFCFLQYITTPERLVKA